MENESLDASLEEISVISEQAQKCVSELKLSLQGRKVNVKVKEYFDTFDARYNDYLRAVASGSDYKQIVSSASLLNVYLEALHINLKNTFEEESNKGLVSKLHDLSTSLKKIIEGREVIFSLSDEPAKGVLQTPLDRPPTINKSLKSSIEAYQKQIQDAEERNEKRLSGLSNRLAEVDAALESIQSGVQSKLEAADSLYSKAVEELERKQKSVDDLLGTISASVIAGGYDSSASAEKKMADGLRAGSLVCMVVIAFVVGFSLYETTIESFKWENSLFRLIFTILLSVPAAYLAGESAKHRQQQYAHLQTSLDLKAITPYLASLPTEEQHKLKSDIANRLFAPKTHSPEMKDSYPISTHELLMKLIDKMDFKSNDRADNGGNKNG